MFQHEVLAMIKQLGCPTFFLTLFVADLKYKEVPEIISKLNKLNWSKEYLESVNYFEKCELLNTNLFFLRVIFSTVLYLFSKKFY